MTLKKEDILYQLDYTKFQFTGNRKEQEDSLYINSSKGFFCICDGLGGEDHGKLASYLLTKSIHELLASNDILNRADLEALVRNAYLKAASKVSTLNIQSSLGTTIIAMIICKDQIIIAHAGDSRAYYFSENQIAWKTKDHSLVQELLDAGILNGEVDIRNHPMKNRITNAIMFNGSKMSFSLDVKIIPKVQSGDFFLLCSDGAIENYSNGEFSNLFLNNSITLNSRWEIFKENAKYSSDNSSAILIRIL